MFRLHRPFQRPLQQIPQQFQRRTFRFRLPLPVRHYQRFRTARTNFLYRWAASPNFYYHVGFMSAGAGGFYLYNTETVPISGRRRFNIISPELEAWFSQGTEEDIKKQYAGRFLPAYDPRVRQVKRVLGRLLPYVQGAGLENVDWEVHVIAGPEQNAFVIPGGKIFVFTGLLPLCRDEHGLAAVLAHEIAHVVAHHPAERISQAPLVLLGVLAVSMFDVSLLSGKMLFDLIFTLPGSRKQESEADYIGLMMMAQGCYNPQAAADFWARMEQHAGGAAPPEVLSTHPAHHNRQAQITEWLPKAYEKQEASDCADIASFAEQFASTMRGRFTEFPRW